MRRPVRRSRCLGHTWHHPAPADATCAALAVPAATFAPWRCRCRLPSGRRCATTAQLENRLPYALGVRDTAQP